MKDMKIPCLRIGLAIEDLTDGDSAEQAQKAGPAEVGAQGAQLRTHF